MCADVRSPGEKNIKSWQRTFTEENSLFIHTDSIVYVRQKYNLYILFFVRTEKVIAVIYSKHVEKTIKKNIKVFSQNTQNIWYD